MSGSGDRRNPYLVLGLPYGSSPKDATRAFVRRQKEIGQGTFAAYRIADLTWALHQVEQAMHEREVDVTIYRVPANRSLFASPPGVGDGGGRGFSTRTRPRSGGPPVRSNLKKLRSCWIRP